MFLKSLTIYLNQWDIFVNRVNSRTKEQSESTYVRTYDLDLDCERSKAKSKENIYHEHKRERSKAKSKDTNRISTANTNVPHKLKVSYSINSSVHMYWHRYTYPLWKILTRASIAVYPRTYIIFRAHFFNKGQP